jgi:hypothetical protein
MNVLEAVQRLERAVGLLQEQLARIEATVERIDANSERNRVVAEKYGDRADTLFSVVDSVGTAMNRVNPLTYLPTGLLSDAPTESSADSGGDNNSDDEDREHRSFVDYYSNLN